MSDNRPIIETLHPDVVETIRQFGEACDLRIQEMVDEGASEAEIDAWLEKVMKCLDVTVH